MRKSEWVSLRWVQHKLQRQLIHITVLKYNEPCLQIFTRVGTFFRCADCQLGSSTWLTGSSTSKVPWIKHKTKAKSRITNIRARETGLTGFTSQNGPNSITWSLMIPANFQIFLSVSSAETFHNIKSYVFFKCFRASRYVLHLCERRQFTSTDDIIKKNMRQSRRWVSQISISFHSLHMWKIGRWWLLLCPLATRELKSHKCKHFSHECELELIALACCASSQRHFDCLFLVYVSAGRREKECQQRSEES